MGSEILLVLTRTVRHTLHSCCPGCITTLETVLRSLFDMLINVAFKAEFSAETRRFKSLNAHLRVEK